jgi:regulation of enolase protein 1 (concanavalin A-like superfamily)
VGTDYSSVVSNPLSDWAMQPYPVNGPLTIRISAAPGRYAKVHLEYKDGEEWIPFRELTGWAFESGENMDVGVLACSPGDRGVRVVLWDIIAQDYSELAFRKGIVDSGGINPNLHPEAFTSVKSPFF